MGLLNNIIIYKYIFLYAGCENFYGIKKPTNVDPSASHGFIYRCIALLIFNRSKASYNWNLTLIL